MSPDDQFTPGRIAYVYFNYKEVNAMLEQKEPGWIRQTGGVGVKGVKLDRTTGQKAL